MEMWSLFHRIAFNFAKKMVLIPFLIAACASGTAAMCCAQESNPNTASDQDKEQIKTPADAGYTQDQGKYRTVDILEPEPVPGQKQADDNSQSETLDAIPVPIAPVDDTLTLGGQALIDDVFQNRRNRFGFSISAYEAYTSDISAENRPKRSSGITVIMPRAFFNFGKRKSVFHMDFGAGYRYYNRSRDSNTWDYQGNSQYSLQLSKRTTFQLADQFTSSFNDAWSFLSLSSPLDFDLLSSNEVLFNRQRITRNAARVELSHGFTSKATISVFGGHRWYDYQRNTLNNSSAIEFGGSFNYQIKKWLYVTSSATAYYNLVEGSLPDARIYHVQFGGLDFHLTDAWRIWAGGGIDISDYQETNRTAEHVSAGIGYTTRISSFSVTYQRGFTSGIGISRLLMSDVASASFGRRFTDWFSTRIESYYYKSSETGTRGLLKTFSGGGSMEFALLRNLVLTTNAYYQNQRTRGFSVSGLGLTRLTGYVGLQYVWPARRQSEY